MAKRLPTEERVFGGKSPALEEGNGGTEHRQFPRAKLAVRISLWVDGDGERKFAATLRTANLSVSGTFIESTFFLPIGTEVRMSFELEDAEEPVQARGEIVREERPNARSGEGRSGFGIRFLEFFGQTEVTLARLFLLGPLASFAETYLGSRRARSISGDFERVVDALAAWELQRATTAEDPWRPLTQRRSR